MNITLSGTKAETLRSLLELGYNVPTLYYFTVAGWETEADRIIDQIIQRFGVARLLAVRSSTKAEDTEDASMAGAFESLLNVRPTPQTIRRAVTTVIGSFDGDPTNQILVQPMVTDVAMSGVVMTQVLDDGSPYYVINYDDSTGATDTVTSGTSINKTVYVYSGVDEADFDSAYLRSVVQLIRRLQITYPDRPLDIEFAIDKSGDLHVLQVRNITTIKKWRLEANALVSSRMLYLKAYVDRMMKPRPNLFGTRTLLGFMPDWNPAEMIGVIPRPLARSLYRTLITKSTWRIARERMGYRKMPNVELMVSLFGRVYIDVRNSINSFLPEGLPAVISEKMVNAYIDRLDAHPHLHDKIEFDVVHTAYDFDFDRHFHERYGDVLSKEEFLTYKGLLRSLTKQAMSNKFTGSINVALRDIEHLRRIQSAHDAPFQEDSFSIADKINYLIDECVQYGTIPFSILARHGFIAEGLLRSAVRNGALSEERLQDFRRSIVTVAGEMTEDYTKVLKGTKSKEEYLNTYGHLRPSSYDILSPNYSQRDNLFDGALTNVPHDNEIFQLRPEERSRLNVLLGEHGFDNLDANALLEYAEKSIKGREYAKFVFTKHLSAILEYAAKWGAIKGFDRLKISMLPVEDILSILFAPLKKDVHSFYQRRIDKATNDYNVAASFKLSYLIRSVRDVHIVPMQRSAPNFISSKRLEAELVELTPYMNDTPSLVGKIVCIEGADPGYDWIFTRGIAGLITKYGGANSHMAIRCAEYDIPAAIGCGEQPYQRVVSAGRCLLDCDGKRLEPINLL